MIVCEYINSDLLELMQIKKDAEEKLTFFAKNHNIKFRFKLKTTDDLHTLLLYIKVYGSTNEKDCKGFVA